MASTVGPCLHASGASPWGQLGRSRAALRCLAGSHCGSPSSAGRSRLLRPLQVRAATPGAAPWRA
eukprot:10278433-Alexandrium_andersonii.AAC.1